MKGCEDVGLWTRRPRAQTMMKSDEVEAMLHLHALGWGFKRIAREFGCSKNTVRRYVEADGWMAYSRQAGTGKLEDQEEWLKERFFRHRGNAEVVRQDLVREQSIEVSLRTVERAVAPFRRLLTAEAKATVRFETGGAGGRAPEPASSVPSPKCGTQFARHRGSDQCAFCPNKAQEYASHLRDSTLGVRVPQGACHAL